MKDILGKIISRLLCLLRNKHEYVTNGITDDTMCDLNSWCKFCGKNYIP